MANGVDPATAAVTYEWHCDDCGATTYVSHNGGQLLEGSCEPHCSAEAMEIHAFLAGKRWRIGTAAELQGARAVARR